MLRIMIYERPQETSFLVEGRLVGRWVKALEKCWEIVLDAEPSKAVLVALAVTSVDFKGRELLARMRRHGVRLEPARVRSMKAIVAERRPAERKQKADMEELPWV